MCVIYEEESRTRPQVTTCTVSSICLFFYLHYNRREKEEEQHKKDSFSAQVLVSHYCIHKCSRSDRFLRWFWSLDMFPKNYGSGFGSDFLSVRIQEVVLVRILVMFNVFLTVKWPWKKYVLENLHSLVNNSNFALPVKAIYGSLCLQMAMPLTLYAKLYITGTVKSPKFDTG
jgi:hypothetical protein